RQDRPAFAAVGKSGRSVGEIPLICVRCAAMADAARLRIAGKTGGEQLGRQRSGGRSSIDALELNLAEITAAAGQGVVLNGIAGDVRIFAGIREAERGSPRASDAGSQLLGQLPGEAEFRIAGGAEQRAVILIVT